jgi:hypothetical protein
MKIIIRHIGESSGMGWAGLHDFVRRQATGKQLRGPPIPLKRVDRPAMRGPRALSGRAGGQSAAVPAYDHDSTSLEQAARDPHRITGLEPWWQLDEPSERQEPPQPQSRSSARTIGRCSSSRIRAAACRSRERETCFCPFHGSPDRNART